MVSDKGGTNYGMKSKSHSIYTYSYNVTGQDDDIHLSGLENWFVVK